MSSERQRVFSGAPWERRVGYCRALRAGAHVYVAGTVAVAEGGGVYAPGDAYAQTRRCLEIATQAMRELGAEPTHVVRTRMFVTDISRVAEYGRAHEEFFGAHPPVSSMVEVKGLVSPELMIEVEVDALLPE